MMTSIEAVGAGMNIFKSASKTAHDTIFECGFQQGRAGPCLPRASRILPGRRGASGRAAARPARPVTRLRPNPAGSRGLNLSLAGPQKHRGIANLGDACSLM
jgi:hypothetical protein